MSLKAQCQCGALHAEIAGEFEAIVVCSCVACQRRSGSPFGEAAYALRSNITFHGEAKEFVRPTDAGNQFHQFFCTSCGTTLYFYSSRGPDRIGIAVGCIENNQDLKPSRSVYDVSKHDWLTFADDMPGFIEGRDSAKTR